MTVSVSERASKRMGVRVSARLTPSTYPKVRVTSILTPRPSQGSRSLGFVRVGVRVGRG